MELPDTNRELVTKHFVSLVKCLKHWDLTAIALVVIFNLCNEYGQSFEPIICQKSNDTEILPTRKRQN
jgi:hypothetical protein